MASFTPDPKELPPQTVRQLEIGEAMPSFRLPNLEGNWVSSDDFADANVFVVLFTCNHCPTAQAYEERIIEYVEDYREKACNWWQ